MPAPSGNSSTAPAEHSPPFNAPANVTSSHKARRGLQPRPCACGSRREPVSLHSNERPAGHVLDPQVGRQADLGLMGNDPKPVDSQWARELHRSVPHLKRGWGRRCGVGRGRVSGELREAGVEGKGCACMQLVWAGVPSCSGSGSVPARACKPVAVVNELHNRMEARGRPHPAAVQRSVCRCPRAMPMPTRCDLRKCSTVGSHAPWPAPCCPPSPRPARSRWRTHVGLDVEQIVLICEDGHVLAPLAVGVDMDRDLGLPGRV